MATFYVLYDEFTRTFVRAGWAGGHTLSLNDAKHFTSKWSAENFRAKGYLLSHMIVKKIVLQ